MTGAHPAASCRSPVAWLAAMVLLAAYALLLPAAMGYCHGGAILTDAWSVINLIIPSLALLILSQRRISRWLIAIPFVAAAGLYLPAGLIYGKPSILISVAVLQTNPTEASEFISITSPWIFVAAAGLLALGLATIQAAKRLQLNGDAICCLIIALSIATTFQIYGFKKGLESIQVVEFTKKLALASWHGAMELREEAHAPAPSWKSVSAAPKYRNYVLVIGESQRRDYASVYGYTLETTPFLDKAPGLFMSGFITPGGNTGISLPRLLSLNIPDSDKFSKANNIITLANAAGFDTWWLSNQGRGGAFDNPIAQIGVRAQHDVWLKGNYADPNVDDHKLLPKLKEALAAPSEKPKLIIMHLMGSHPAFCTRLSGRPVLWNVGDASMDCYLTTYRTMDDLLQKTTRELRAQGEPWSLVYFADHGLSMENKPGSATGKELEHGYDSKQNYEVPLLMLSSNATKHVMNPAIRSGYRLLDGLADWMGIKTPTISKSSNSSFWGGKADRDVRVFGGKRFDLLRDDPPILYHLTR